MLSKWLKRFRNAKGAIMNYVQQGDVLLKETTKPSGVRILKTDLLHKGQNHHHRLKGKFKIAVTKDGKKYVYSKGAVLFHEEHKDIQVPEGFYEFGVVVEYNHWEEESRQVID
jgi:hypothetical protein